MADYTVNYTPLIYTVETNDSRVYTDAAIDADIAAHAALVNGVHGLTTNISAALTAANSPSAANPFASIDQIASVVNRTWQPQGVILDATTADEQLQMQEPNVLYDTDPQILVGNTHVFKMWYSAGYANPKLFYAESVDGIAWTKYSGNPIISDHTRCFVLKNGAQFVMFAVSGGSLDRLTSNDGLIWSVTNVGVLSGTPAAWDANGPDNSCIWIEGATWYMLYEAGNGTRYQIGLATSADSGVTWSKSLSNPVITSIGAAGSVSGPFVYKSGLTYWCWLHIADSGALPTDISRYYSTNLTDWTRDPIWLSYPRNSRDEGISGTAGQVADVSLVEVAGTTYMYYAGYLDGSTAAGRIKLATAPYTLTQLVTTEEGVITTGKPNLLINESFERLGAGGADVVADWTETVGTGAISRTTTAGEYRPGTSGRAALKLTAGASGDTFATQAVVLKTNTRYAVTGWARGDGTNNGGRVRIYGSADLIDFANAFVWNGTSYKQFIFTFESAANNGATIYLWCSDVNGATAYFDDASLVEV